MVTLNELYPSKYLRAADLKGKEVRVSIETVAIEEFENDGRPQRKPVAYFKGSTKGLVLSKTNSMMLADICGSEDTDAWPGFKVTLYATMVPFQGRVTEAIRIDRAPSAQAAVQPAPSAPAAAADLDDEIPF